MRVRDLVELISNWYREVRAEGVVPPEDDGDMLLFQWGPRDDLFEVDLTRQFISAESEDDDAIWQLSVTLSFPLTESARSLEAGGRWCPSPEEVETFAEQILGGPVVGAFGRVAPKRSTARLENAG